MEKQKTRRPKKEGRLHLRVDKELEARMHDYVARHGTTLNAVATRLFMNLLETERRKAAREQEACEAEQV